MNIQRLQMLIDLLDRIPAEAFDLSLWTNGCGTVACAIGHACLDPEFNKLGLMLRTGGMPGLWVNGVGFVAHNYNAIAQFFGISEYTAYWLFAPDQYFPRDWHDPKVVVERIKQYISKEQNKIDTIYKNLTEE